MAMLAERKQKVKWCLNPRGNDWAKDENKFGQRMLEKMGWQPGMGLGAKGQGRTDFVRLQMKNDTKGLGNKEKYDEVWTRQQENFDSLLAQLNGTDRNEIIDSNNIPSLEDKSKTSRARVHYHKFTRGKDVSKYSSKDLNSIIGIGKKAPDSSSELVTESSLSMYDYFNSKSKKKRAIEDSEILNSVDNNENPNEIKLDEPTIVNDECESTKKEKKRSKKKKIDYGGDLEDSKTDFVDENISDKHDKLSDELVTYSINPIKKKKRKKRKSMENENINDEEQNSLDNYHEITGITSFEENINNESQDNCLKKKKKKRHKNKENNLED